ncbi:MAG: TlpA disulfide reductase family protein [Acidobacteriota bacterium]
MRFSFVILVFGIFAVLLTFGAGPTSAQSENAVKPLAKTIFRDSDGNLIPNDEFVDIRMANFHVPDRTLVHTLDDGTIEFRLQKIPQEGAVAPEFATHFVDGSPVKFSELRGKVVVLNFWFIGCPACLYETPKLNELAAKFAGDPNIEFVAMTNDPAAAVRKYVAAHPFDYKLIADAKPILASFVVGGYPKNIVIGKDGRIVYWRSNIHAWDKFESVIRAELAK